jgi:hypothetical protein
MPAPADAVAAVAANPGAPLRVLRELVRHPDPWVRRSLAGNPAIDGLIAEALAADREQQVRQYLSSNEAATIGVLEKLSRNPDETVRTVAARALVQRKAQRESRPPLPGGARDESGRRRTLRSPGGRRQGAAPPAPDEEDVG